MKKALFLFSFFLTLSSQAQDSIRIYGQLLHNTRFAKVVVRQFGIGAFDIAAFPIRQEDGSFYISAPAEIQPGIYRFQYSQSSLSEYVDVIINGQDKEIRFSMDIRPEVRQREPVFSASAENMAWHSFRKQYAALKREIESMDAMLATFPEPNQKIYRRVQADRDKKVTAILKFKKDFTSQTPFYWAARLAEYAPEYFPNPRDDWRLQAYYRQERFWQGKPTNDSTLLNTPLYTDAVLEYVRYWMDPEMGFGEEELKNGFRKSVDTLIQRFSGNSATKTFIIKYLQLGFKEIGNEEILKYIDQTYAAHDEQCTEEDDELQKRLKGYAALEIGKPAPPLKLATADGKLKTLRDFEQEEVVLVFWASWCPHCMEEMPRLQEWAKANPKTLVLAVSLDDDFQSYQTAAQSFPDILHYCDFQKWKGEIPEAWYVAATPTLFVLDKNRNIKQKSGSIRAFVESSK